MGDEKSGTVRRFGEVLGRSVGAWIAHRDDSKGAALAFYALFSMTPILVLAIAGAGYLFGAEAARDEVFAQVQALAGTEGARAIVALLAGVRAPDSSGLATTLIAAIIALVGATTAFVELKASLDEIWGLEPPRGPAAFAFLRTRLHSFGLVLLLGLLLIASLSISAALAVLEHHAGAAWSGTGEAMAALSSLASLAVIACLFAVIFKGLQDAPLSWRDAWIGAIFTTVLFALGKFAIGAYLKGSAVATGFGAAGSLIALLLWVYYSAQILLLGAEFTRQYALALGSLKPPPAD